jgi:hypothetical protein
VTLRQDVGAAALRCVDPQTRKVHWEEAGFGYATLLKADGKLVIVLTDGQLVLAAPRPDRYRELARATVRRPRPERGALGPARDRRLTYEAPEQW